MHHPTAPSRPTKRFTRSRTASAVQLGLVDDEAGLDRDAVAELEQHLERDRTLPAVVDLDSRVRPAAETLVLLCAMLRRSTAAGGAIAVVNADARVRRVLELCRIDGVRLEPGP